MEFDAEQLNLDELNLLEIEEEIPEYEVVEVIIDRFPAISNGRIVDSKTNQPFDGLDLKFQGDNTISGTFTNRHDGRETEIALYDCRSYFDRIKDVPILKIEATMEDGNAMILAKIIPFKAGNCAYFVIAEDAENWDNGNFNDLQDKLTGHRTLITGGNHQ